VKSTIENRPLQDVDSIPPFTSGSVLAIQHVLTMYASAVTVPLLVGLSLNLPISDRAYLISSSLFGCGLATMLQSLGVRGVGVRLPVVMGITFVGLAPAIAIAHNPSLGLPGVYGAAILAGLLSFLLAPVAGRVAHLLPPLVTGTTLLLVGLSLVKVAIDWSAGGLGAPDYGSPGHLFLAAITLAIILTILRYGNSALRSCSILIGLVLGTIVSAWVGDLDLTAVGREPSVRLILPFHFGAPRFDLFATASMLLVLLVTFIESAGMLKMLGVIVGRPLTANDLRRGLAADAVGSILGGLFNGFPCTSYSQNIAVVEMTRVKSRFVVAGAGVILILLALLPKLSALVALVPLPVLGGAALILFGLIAASGIRSLGEVDFTRHGSAVVVATSLTIGLAPTVSPSLIELAPRGILPLLNSGVLTGTLTAVVLSQLFRSAPSAQEGDPVAPPAE
jgi:uric acid transporter